MWRLPVACGGRVLSVRDGDNLERVASRPVYADCRIGEIRVERGNEFMELRARGEEQYMRPGQVWGDVDGLAVQREMIRRTIREHLDKQKRLRPHGIKVLSLFFIDEVARYRQYDDDGNQVKGDYARIFEEEYRRLGRHPDYHMLFGKDDLSRAAAEAHGGYFSIDKRGGWTDTAEGNQAGRDNAERAYRLIMRQKEKLLAFETPLQFIFSHSALREGWDNPNVFQVCALRDIHTERERRQTVGRGLRLCVDQAGRRLRGADVNTLTVIATESYEEFAESLQKEIEHDTGFRFGVVEPYQFAAVRVAAADGSSGPLGMKRSQELCAYLKGEGYIDANGNVQNALRMALKNRTLKLPKWVVPLARQIDDILRKLAGRLEIKNADERRQVRPRQAVLHSPEFKALWDRIKYKTHLPLAFRQREAGRELHPSPARCSCDSQDTAAMAQGRNRHRPSGCRGDRA